MTEQRQRSKADAEIVSNRILIGTEILRVNGRFRA